MTSTTTSAATAQVAVEEETPETTFLPVPPTAALLPVVAAVPAADAIGPETDVEPVEPEAPSPAAPGALAAACAAGKVRLFKLRGTGTLRRLPYLTGLAREEAEYYAYRLATGDSVATIAVEVETSRATVRRNLAALALTEEIESGLHDDIWEDGLAEVIFGGYEDEEA
ncbi:hypothetical protein JIG36_37410 [Actinoplanes sp. LDG1-06]|uniref:Helix-turn-helix domain-containing protein n=1 Tax=Paractinoplanes ovalisporus TaxID=2810368 RepID=A0ABS2AN33_9ACTN|nr:hypothetical protein [Actinoplanes ovalisporus]MBM2621196.1 hypothetical protein [Actinoplanes ovalisporus]